MRKTIVAYILLGVVPFTLAACSGVTSQKTAATTNAKDSRMAQMGDGSMSRPGSSSPTVMDSGSMMNMDLGPKDANFDLRFIDGMTPHHEGAIAMAQEALQKSKRPEIKPGIPMPTRHR
jgi:uncharacterized protein (DUF305 family)